MNIDIKSWKKFSISKLFVIKSPASRSIKTYTEGQTPYVSSSSINNGIISYLKPKHDLDLERGNCITVSPLDGTSFYQEFDFLGRGGAGSAISMLYNEKLNKYNALFICTVIRLSAQKYNYNDALTSDNLKNLTLLLPILHDRNNNIIFDKNNIYSDEGYIPDWTYMECYMKTLLEKSEKDINILKKIIL